MTKIKKNSHKERTRKRKIKARVQDLRKRIQYSTSNPKIFKSQESFVLDPKTGKMVCRHCGKTMEEIYEPAGIMVETV